MTPRRARPRTLLEDPQRWSPCPRCGHSYQRARLWPEGRVCHYCATAALQRTGHCATCGHDGVLPGLDDHGRLTCITCSRIPAAVTCRRCSTEAPLGRSSTCWRCLLTAKTTALLTGPDGQVPDPLRRLADAITGMPSANSGHAWLSNPDVAAILRRLAAGDLELDHAALDELPTSRTVEHLRGLLLTHGCLPARDPHLAGYERWLAAKLDTVTDPDHRAVIDRFARWHLLRQLRDRATRGPITDGTFLNAKQSTTVTVGFLSWLAGRDLILRDLTQHEIDTWFATGPSTRKHAVRFLYWARDQRLIARDLEIPTPRTSSAHPTGTRDRLALLNRALVDTDLGPTVRLAAALVLLFGATPRQIAGLRLTDVTDEEDQTWLQIGSHPLPLPSPVAALLQEFLGDPRYRRNTANHDSVWLFPGETPGRPVRTTTLADALRKAGIPTQSARAGAWMDLVRNAPPALLAEALGVSTKTASHYAERAGSSFAAYPHIRRHE